jgi:coenzyme Q-binding protein COQ10
MTKFSISRRVPYTIEQIFHIAGDVSSYKDFLPLVKKSIVRNRVTHPDGRTTFEADLTIAYAKLGILETLTSRCVVDPKTMTVRAESSEGPVKSLLSEWKFVDLGKEGTDIQYSVDYTLKSRSLQFLISGMFDMIMRRIMGAFEARAQKLYGSKAA